MAMSEKELAATVAELQREVTFLRGIVVGQADKIRALEGREQSWQRIVSPPKVGEVQAL